MRDQMSIATHEDGRPKDRAGPTVTPFVRPHRVDQSKTVEVMIMKFSPYGSPIPLVFAE